ncbi:MAG: DUF2007 domain-containing protein [Gammaproteobacteria bacterium]
MKCVLSTTDTALLEYVRRALDERGIGVFVRNATNSGSIAGELTPVIARPEIWVVAEEDHVAGERLVARTLESLRPVSTDPWICPKCGEHLEAQFEVCWACGQARVLEDT